MRNLLCTGQHRLSIDGALAQIAWSPAQDRDEIICGVGPENAENPTIEIKRYGTKQTTANGVQNVIKNANTHENFANNHDCEIIAAWDAPCPLQDLEKDKILLLQDFGDRLSVVLAGGDIVVVRKEPLSSEEKIEIVGSVDAGIIAAKWSPDESILAVTTRVNTFLLMTATYDEIANHELTEKDASLSKHVSVGWGKSETQFKGKRAKALRDPTMPEKVDEGKLSSLENGNATISWRGDSAFVALNSLQDGCRRLIRVFTREGGLDSVSEPVDGLEDVLSWRPDGMLLSAIQRLENETKVIFFERNGLRHGQFNLRSDVKNDICQMPIDLIWNGDSSVLAISFLDRVQLWTMSNYHYYLKQEILMPSLIHCKSPLSVRWHGKDPNLLAIWRENPQLIETTDDNQLHSISELRIFGFVSVVSQSSTIPPLDFGLKTVIDGCNLKLTPLALANTPPPMALHTVKLNESAIDVAVNEENTQMAVLHSNSISKYRLATENQLRSEPRFYESVELQLNSDQAPYQVLFDHKNCVNILIANLKNGYQELYDPRSRSSANLWSMEHQASITRTINGTSQCIMLGSNVYELFNTNQAPLSQSKPITSFPTAVKIFVAVRMLDQKTIVFGLSASGSLFAGNVELVANCTSFAVTSSHLVFTTTNDLLKFAHLASMETDIEVPPDHPETDERCRSVEKGARIVAVVPSRFSVVLQMPRGNLETVFPRALVIAGIRQKISSKDYREAFHICRNHRVDLNILHDHNPEQFLSLVPLVIDQLEKVEYIDLFLSQLSEENVSETLYKDTFPVSSKHVESDVHISQAAPNSNQSGLAGSTLYSKVNSICDKFLKYLSSRLSTNLQNVMTANLCKSPPDIEAGLRVIIDLRENQSDLVDSAVEHVCFLTDVNRIYEAALGLYDLQLTLLVAQQSQKDPREYIPYLRTLQAMPQHRMQFRINDDLGRRSKALQSLQALDDFEAFLRYTERYGLHRYALDLFRYDMDHQNRILRSYAEHLSSRNRFKDAAIAWESLSDYDSASSAYRAANLWRESLYCAQMASGSPEEISNLASSLADSLEESKDYTAVAIINLEYLSDLDKAFRNLCKSYQFTEATRLAVSKQRPNLVEQVIDPGLIDASATLTELLADCKAQLNAQVPRLRELREKKLKDPLAFFEGTRISGEGGDIPDNISLAPSDTSTTGGTLLTQYTQRTGTGTLGTNATRRTSKNRRREERKRARGKKGSVYEEEYLVNSIGRLIERVNTSSDDVTRTVEGCLKRGMRERAIAIENAMVDVTETCKACMDEVWEIKAQTEGQNVASNGVVAREESVWGADDVYLDSIESWKKSGPPAVKTFSRSELL